MTNEIMKSYVHTVGGFRLNVALPETGGFEIFVDGEPAGNAMTPREVNTAVVQALSSRGVASTLIANIPLFSDWPLETLDGFDPEADV